MTILDLPRDIPWRLVGVRQDMMHTQFCKEMSVPWRSSIAIFAYEPKPADIPDDLPEGLCDQITYLKVTCSITGYQLSKETVDRFFASHPDLPETLRPQLVKLLEEYLACYGVLLNVAVFPYPETSTVRELVPATVDFSQIMLEQRGGQKRLPDPYYSNRVSFQSSPYNLLVDFYPGEGDVRGELFLNQTITATFPPSARVELSVVHDGQGVTAIAFKDNEQIGSPKTVPLDPRQVHKLSIEGESINRVSLRAGNKAQLLEFTYFEPRVKPIELINYPHIVDFEPKTRDLYQVATETGEVLSASNSEVVTGKSTTNTQNSETGVSAEAGISYGPASLTAGFTHKWGETTQDASSTQIDASRERRERESTTTNISQMYNILTGYHLGTNRATFIMLPRPHILQPTDRRTFIRGLRVIEGIQEFFLVVARPKNIMEGLSVEALLETGHYPEDITLEGQAEQYEESYEDFWVDVFVGEGTDEEDNQRLDIIHNISSPNFVVDTRLGRKDPDGREAEPGHAGVIDIQNDSHYADPNEWTTPSTVFPAEYQYGAISSGSVRISGQLRNEDEDSYFRHRYRILTRRDQPFPNSGGYRAKANFIISSRGLCTTFKSTGRCPEVVSTQDFTQPDEWVVDERTFELDPVLLMQSADNQTRLPAMKETIRKIHSMIATSWKSPSRLPYGTVNLLNSDYFTRRILEILPMPLQKRLPITKIGFLPTPVSKMLGPSTSIEDALSMNLHLFANKTGLSVADAAKTRSNLIDFYIKRAGEEVLRPRTKIAWRKERKRKTSDAEKRKTRQNGPS